MCKILSVVVAFFLWALANSTFLGRDSLPLVLIITSTSDLQPSTPTANQLPGQLVYTEIRTMDNNEF